MSETSNSLLKLRVLITGASSGIGRDMARVFAENGHPLILVSRDQVKLEEFARDLASEYGTDVRIIAADLSVSDNVEYVYKEVVRTGSDVDILVNNAGYGFMGEFLEGDLDNQMGMIHLNISALTELAWRFGRDMKSRGRGGILNVGSMAGFAPGPYMAIYYATKAYVLFFTEALRTELKSSGVRVSCLCPGPVRTGFFDRARMMKAVLSKGKYVPVLDSLTVARSAYDGFMQNRSLIMPGIISKILPYILRITPRNLSLQIVKKFNRP